MSVKWKVIDLCPALDEGQYLCQLERGHAGDHLRTDWEDGEIVGPVYWSEVPAS